MARCIARASRDLGVNESTLPTWIGKYRDDIVPTVERRLGRAQEFLHLQKENRRLKEERDRLKKAAAYFASQSR